MDRGLSFVDCISITGAGLTTSVAGGFSSICSTPTVDDAGGGTTVDLGRRVTFDFGTFTNPGPDDVLLTITYRAVVLDNAGNISAANLRNSAQWTWGTSGSLGPVRTTVTVAEPDLSISKTANTSTISVGSEVTITLTIQHTSDSETNAYDVVVTDTLPAGLRYVPGSLECISGAQDADAGCTESGGTITAQWSNFTLGGGNGQITFRVTITSLPEAGITNTANVAWTSLPGDVRTPQTANIFSKERDYDPASQVDIYGTSDSLVLGASAGGGSRRRTVRTLPDTGFAPNVSTDISNLPREIYTQTGDVTLEIPSLEMKTSIVGVPFRNGGWNVAWLGGQAGWLEGTSFPTWDGNSVITSHVYLSNGLPGPFVHLGKLKYGDKVLIHAYGQKYTFEVRSNVVVAPNDESVFKHEERPWLTLVTCREYDEKTNAYRKRVVVRAVLVNVVDE
jgi:LPXTG-site transpeptidase (sortase) family protein